MTRVPSGREANSRGRGTPAGLWAILNAIARTAARLCEANDALILRLQGDQLRFVAKHGRIPMLEALGESLPFSRRAIAGRAVLERRTIHVHDLAVAVRKEFPETRAAQRASGSRTVLVTPLLRNGSAIGAIVIRRTTVRPFTAKQIALLKTFADQAAIAIENARLSEALHARNRELTEALEQQTATSEILRVISSSPTDVQPVFDAIIGNAVRLCGAVYGIVWRYEGDLTEFVSAHNLQPEELEELRRLFPRRTDVDTDHIHTMMRSGAVLAVPDIEAYEHVTPQQRARWRARGVRSLLVVPMRRDREVIGAIGVSHRDVGAFPAGRVELLKTFADQAVIAVENVRLFKELQTKNRELTEALERQTATAEILRVISSSPTDVQPIFDAIVESAARLCASRFATLHRVDGDLIHLVAHRNLTPEVLAAIQRVYPMPLSSATLTGRAIVERAVVHIHDIRTDPSVPPAGREIARVMNHRSLVYVPMLAENRSIGTINVGRDEPFSDAEIALLQTFANQAVIAIENVRLFTALETRNRELSEALEQQTATGEILRVISSSPTDLQPVFDTIARNALRLCDGRFSAVFRSDGRLIHLVAQQNFSAAALEHAARAYPTPIDGPGPLAAVVREARLNHASDVENDPLVTPESLQIPRSLGVRSHAAVPMIRDASAIGAIIVGRTVVGPFSDANIDLLKTFADQAVIAIENVRLFRELEARNRELTEALERQTATADILRVIGSSPTDVQPIFDAIVRSASRLCGGEYAIVTRYDGELLHLVAQHNPRPGADDETARYFPQVPRRETSINARALVDATVVHLPDVETEDFEPAAREFYHRIGLRAVVAVPMVHEGRPIGVVSVSRGTPGPFSGRQVDLLRIFADQAVIAIENVRLFKELQERNRELMEALEQQTATSEVLKVISRSQTDVQPVFDTIARSAAVLCGAAFSVVFRLEDDVIDFVAHHSFTPEGLAIMRRLFPAKARERAAGWVALRRTILHIPDVEKDPRATPTGILEAGRALGYRSLLIVPMHREGMVLGAISVNRSAPGSFSDRHIELLQTFADQAVIAIENTRLLGELQTRTAQLTRSVEELTALGEVSRALSSTLDLETVLNTIVTRANQLAGTDTCSVFEYDEQAEEFHLRATYNLDAEFVALTRRTPIRKGEGALGRMAVTREPVQIPDIAREDAYRGPLRDLLLRSGWRALLAIPLQREDHLIGGLAVNKETPGEFAPEIVELLKTFATQSALAIQNARLFREIEAKSRELEIASQHKSQFLANMSHELRTPLNAILGYTELIADGIYGEAPEKMREVLERVQQSGRHLLGLINDILDLSKIEAGQLTLALGDYSMEVVAGTVATAVEALAAEKKLRLDVTVDPDLPMGHGDERRLTQVLLNLVGNAIKFTEVGSVGLRAGVTAGSFLVAVADTGPGIAESDREKIFEEFQQATSTTTRAKGGTGLGLAIARRIIELHGGRLWVESTLGQGSTFSFTVPVRVEHQVATTARRASS